MGNTAWHRDQRPGCSKDLLNVLWEGALRGQCGDKMVFSVTISRCSQLGPLVHCFDF